MTNSSKNTTAYVVQSIVSFGIALTVVVVGEVNLPVTGWTRAFLALGTVFLVSSSFALAKFIRDQQETESVVSRIDQARIERMLAEYAPYRVPTVGDAPAPRAFG